MGDEKGGRFREWRSRVSDRLARSSRVFLLGVIVACGVEVMTDWGATLNEINALRTNVRHKGENYVGILGKPSQSALRARDTKELERISDGVFDDEDAAVVRYYDATGKVVFEHVRPEYASTFELHRPLYDHLMERDVSGMLSDPASYKARVKNSRYRDFSQIWTDFTARLSRIVSAPSPPRVLELIVFQDRLRDENHAQTDRVAWAVGVLRDDTDKAGAVVVMFDMRKTNAAVRAKYIKGLGVLAFFLALIVVQNIIARRDKLRLLDLQTRYGNAKSALREALPEKNLETRGIRVAGRLEQAKGPVDGMAWFVSESGERIIVLVVDPDGDGIDAASVGLHMIKVFRARCEAGVANLDDEVTALGAATTDIPLTRPVGLTLVALDPATGAYDADSRLRPSTHDRVWNLAHARRPIAHARSKIAGSRWRRWAALDVRRNAVERFVAPRFLRGPWRKRRSTRRRRTRSLPRTRTRPRRAAPRRRRSHVGPRPKPRACRERHRDRRDHARLKIARRADTTRARYQQGPPPGPPPHHSQCHCSLDTVRLKPK